MAGSFHPPLEEYLETIYALEEEGARVIQARLAERLGHSAPSVSETVRRLRDEGFLEIDRRSVRFTPLGRERAESVVRRHRLAERLLTDVIGLPWHEAHREAGRWEHVISESVEARLVELLGHPTTCPHGNPIPGAGGHPAPQSALADVLEGESVRVERVTEVVEADPASMLYLSEHGVLPGRDATLTSVAPDGTRTLSISGGTVALGPALARQLYVSRARGRERSGAARRPRAKAR
ncbi:MAG TPA: metal-dependent transcriptional regulator [Acidimicrobiales bacterium]|nr:metal-dependent transcriptional regulator [Acidimicrobiales bacterium]